MKPFQYRSIILYIIPALILMYPSSVLPKSSQKEINKGNPGKIVIRSNTLEIDDKRNIVTFTGDVNARRDDFTITCQKMLLYYSNEQIDKVTGKEEISIKKIIATGGVTINRSDGGVATAEKAIYYQNDEKVVLTGKPVLKQENDLVEGSKITLFLKEKRSIVEGSEGNKIRAVLFPRTEKGGSVER